MENAQVMIHVRFSPNGTVTEISERPASLSPQLWFNRLTKKAGTGYQPLSGGRGVFRLARSELETIKAAAAT